MARPREFDEGTVIVASRDLFWDRGYTATRIDDRSAATDSGRGSIYKAIGDEHALFVRSPEMYCALALYATRAELRTSDLSACQRLNGDVRGFTAGVAGDGDRRGRLLTMSADELSSTDLEVAKQTKPTATVQAAGKHTITLMTATAA